MEEDVLKFMDAGTLLVGTNLDFQMNQYKRISDGVINIFLKLNINMFFSDIVKSGH